ncbi:unnamed protein product, partial [Didymodactylos carnosus]
SGLGLERIFKEIIKLYCADHSLVFIVGCTDNEQAYFILELIADGIDPPPRVVTTDILSNERRELYLQGGIFFVTSRILTVDMLTFRVPIELISGLLVYRAHRITDSSPESFILRLYREKNKHGFIKGFSDSSIDFSKGYNQLELVMKNLFLKNLYLYPRFQATIRNTFDKSAPDVIELQIPMTSSMIEIELSLRNLINICLQDLKQSTTYLDNDILNTDNVILTTFDRLIYIQLQPVWNQISFRTKQIINDIKTLRLFILYLTQYDCVTFYNAIYSVYQNERLYGNKSKSINSSQASTGNWLLLPAAETLLMVSKARVFGEPPKKKKLQQQQEQQQQQQTQQDDGVNVEQPVTKPKLEENPKWKVVADVLDEIRKKDNFPELGSPCVLIVCADDRACSQLKQYLTIGGHEMLEHLLELTLHPTLANESNESKNSTEKDKKKKHTSTTKKSINGIELDDIEGGYVINDFSDMSVVLYPFSGNIDNHFVLGKILLKYRPRYVILHDASLTFVRQLEVFKATNIDHPLRVYFLLYSNSIEEQRYLLSVKKEKDAFENLIREKATMVIPEERDGRCEDNPLLSRDATPANQMAYGTVIDTRKGGLLSETVRAKVIVDMREFRSELPSLIYKRGIDIEPVTLEVGDYILTPEICVERKSVSDLIESLNNGRLYTQALQMTRFYKRPILLIEFNQNHVFHLTNKNGISNDFNSNDITSKLALLTMHFPKLRILWCPSPHASAELFEDLK